MLSVRLCNAFLALVTHCNQISILRVEALASDRGLKFKWGTAYFQCSNTELLSAVAQGGPARRV